MSKNTALISLLVLGGLVSLRSTQASALPPGRSPAILEDARDIETISNEETVIDGADDAPIHATTEEFQRSEQALLKMLIETDSVTTAEE